MTYSRECAAAGFLLITTYMSCITAINKTLFRVGGLHTFGMSITYIHTHFNTTCYIEIKPNIQQKKGQFEARCYSSPLALPKKTTPLKHYHHNATNPLVLSATAHNLLRSGVQLAVSLQRHFHFPLHQAPIIVVGWWPTAVVWIEDNSNQCLIWSFFQI